MHELSLIQSILSVAVTAAEEHKAKRIKSIRLLIGDRSHISRDSLDFHFKAMSKGTIAEGASLEVGVLETSTKCVKCGALCQVVDGDYVCPSCGGTAAVAVGDEGVRVDSLEIE